MSVADYDTWSEDPGNRPRKQVIAVGSKAARFNVVGSFADGETATIEDVRVTFDDEADALVIHPPGRAPLLWPFDELRHLKDQAGRAAMLLGRGNKDPARLEISAEHAPVIRTRAGNLGVSALRVRRRRLLGLAVMAVTSVVLMILFLVPRMADQLAGYLPPEGEAALGEATFEQIRAALDQTGLGARVPICEGADGLEALANLTKRMEGVAAGLETPVTVRVLDHPMVNAFALPGGNVVLFRGLIHAAEAPDEVAAVLAHEIGHVAARDPTRIALRSAGSIGVLGLLFGDFAGGAMVLFLAERIIQADYTQEAEAAADTYGSELMLAIDASPAALATFFQRLQAEHGEAPEIVQHFLSHPTLGDRISAAQQQADGLSGVMPVLTAQEWAAVQAVCD